MAMKGKTYTKTSWTFAERPVASSKLNTWDDRIEAALELVCFLLSQAWGGGDGVIRKAAEDDLAVQASAVPDLSVRVRPGYAFIGQFPYRLESETPTVAVTAPASNPRIDLVQARLDTWDVALVPGVEAATPAAPEPGANAIALAQLHLRPGMTSIKNTDDGVNGYIVDVRTFL